MLALECAWLLVMASCQTSEKEILSKTLFWFQICSVLRTGLTTRSHICLSHEGDGHMLGPSPLVVVAYFTEHVARAKPNPLEVNCYEAFLASYITISCIPSQWIGNG